MLPQRCQRGIARRAAALEVEAAQVGQAAHERCQGVVAAGRKRRGSQQGAVHAGLALSPEPGPPAGLPPPRPPDIQARQAEALQAVQAVHEGQTGVGDARACHTELPQAAEGRQHCSVDVAHRGAPAQVEHFKQAQAAQRGQLAATESRPGGEGRADGQ